MTTKKCVPILNEPLVCVLIIQFTSFFIGFTFFIFQCCVWNLVKFCAIHHNCFRIYIHTIWEYTCDLCIFTILYIAATHSTRPCEKRISSVKVWCIRRTYTNPYIHTSLMLLMTRMCILGMFFDTSFLIQKTTPLHYNTLLNSLMDSM